MTSPPHRLACLAAALVFLLAVPRGAHAGDEAPVASATVPRDAWALVDGVPVTKEAVSKRAKAWGLPPAHVLDWIIVERITAAHLEKEGFPLSSVTADELEKLKAAFAGQGGLPPGAEDESLRVNVAFRKRVEKDATDDALKAWFEKHKLELAGEVRARHVLLSTRDGEAAALERAKKVLAAVAADGSNMAALARDQSEDPTAPLDGGDLDWFPRSPLARRPLVHVYEPVVRACFELGKPGLVPAPVLARDGYHVVYVTGTRFIREPSFDEHKDRVKALFLVERAADLVQGWRAESKIVIAEDAPRLGG